MTTANIGAARRALIAAVLDRLVPAGDGFPGAGEAALDHVVDVLQRDEPTAALLREAFDAITIAATAQGASSFATLPGAEQDALLRQIEAAQPARFDALLVHTYGGYYSNPAVLRVLGRDPHPPQPHGYRLEPTDLRLIERVGQQEPFWRQA